MTKRLDAALERYERERRLFLFVWVKNGATEKEALRNFTHEHGRRSGAAEVAEAVRAMMRRERKKRGSK